MKRIAMLLAGMGLVAFSARADDEEIRVKNERDHKIIEHKTRTGKTRTKAKVESKSRRKLLKRGRVDTTETVQETDRPGVRNDRKRRVLETKERDEAGNVIRHEKKVDD